MMNSKQDHCKLCGLPFQEFEEKVGLNAQNGKITTCLYHKDCFRCTVCNRPLSVHNYFLSGKRNFYCINHCNFESSNSHSSIVRELRMFRAVTKEKLGALAQNVSPYGLSRRPKSRESELGSLSRVCFCQENSLVFSTSGYWIECCNEDCQFLNNIKLKHQWITKDRVRKLSESAFELEHYEEEVYESCFIGKEHHNYYTIDEDIGPIVLSLKQDLIRNREYFRVLLRSSCHIVGGLLPVSCICANKYSEDEVVGALAREMQLTTQWKRLHDNKITEHLRQLDKVMLKAEFKVGVLYVAEGQEKEEDFFNNTHHSEEFEEFLDFLGDKIELKGFTKYNGGLDTQFGLTGDTTVFSEWEKSQFMFHVSTLLPLEEHDEQKLQRKRHIGNDIVCIVFLASDNAKFRPNSIKSNFLHTFIAVQPKEGKPTRYQVAVVSRDLVLPYGPPVPSNPVFQKDLNFKNWLMTKIINGERASYRSPKFAAMQERTRKQLLEEMLPQEDSKDVQEIRKDKTSSFQKLFQAKINGKSTSFDSGKRQLSQFSGWISERFDDTESLRMDMSRTFNSGLLEPFYDITFLVGMSQPKAIPGVKAILATRSRVFHEMLIEGCTDMSPICSPTPLPKSPAKPPLHKSASSPPVVRTRRKISFDILRKRTSSERQFKRDDNSEIMRFGRVRSRIRSEYLVTEFEAEEFLLLMEYLHTGTCIISTETLPGLLGAADHYQVDDLIKLCLNCAEDLMTPKTVCPLLVAVRKHCLRYSAVRQLQEKLLAYIAANCREVFDAFDVAALSEDCLFQILSLETDFNEMDKFLIVKQWFARNYHTGIDCAELLENSSPLLRLIDLNKLNHEDLLEIRQSNLFPSTKIDELLASHGR